MKLIDENKLADLIRDSIKLSYLEAGGVDNWDWYDASLEDYWNNEDLDDDKALTKNYKDA